MSTSVASVTNHFPSAENGFSTSTSASVSSGATTVQLNSVAGYDNGEVVVFVIDPTDTTKKQTFTGVVDTAGTQITNVVWTAGSNTSHALGATVVDYATATHISMISKGLSVSLNQDGTLKANTVGTTNISNDAVTTNKILNSNVTTAKIADDAVTDAKLDYPRFWQEIARTTLSVAGDTITVSSIPARNYLRFLFVGRATGGTIDSSFTLNGDTGSNYSYSAINGGAFGNSINMSNMALEASSAATGQLVFASLEFVNLATYQKLGVFTSIANTASGAGTAPSQYIANIKWANSTNQISSITWTNGGTGDFAIGSEIIVLGHD